MVSVTGRKLPAHTAFHGAIETARLNRPGSENWYTVAARWVDAALVKGDSLFTPGKAVWTLESLNELHHWYVEKFDAGDRSFFEKLIDQLADARPEVVQLMAETLYAYYLAADGMKPQTKRDGVRQVLSKVNPPVMLPPDLSAALEHGIARKSQSYTQQRYQQLKFVLDAAIKWWSLPSNEREQLLHDPWRFKNFLGGIEVYYSQAAQQLLLHMVHPDTFEPIMAADQKELIAETLATEQEKGIEDTDRRLQATCPLLSWMRSTKTTGAPIPAH